MSNGVNRITLIGNLGRDPEMRATGGGAEVANLNLAVNGTKKENGEWVEHVEWVRIVAFGKTAENIGKYLGKGSQIYVEGRMQTRSWEDKEGNKRYTTEVVAQQVVFLSGKKESGMQYQGGGSAKHTGTPEPIKSPFDDGDDQIPF